MRKPKEEASGDGVASVTVAVEIPLPYKKVFTVVSDPFQLPKWAKPIKAVRQTEAGGVEVDYELSTGPMPCPSEKEIDEQKGIVDWIVHPPTGVDIKVHSRVIPLDDANSVYVFTLLSPPMPKKKMKDARGVVHKNLTQDLNELKTFILTGKGKS